MYLSKRSLTCCRMSWFFRHIGTTILVNHRVSSDSLGRERRENRSSVFKFSEQTSQALLLFGMDLSSSVNRRPLCWSVLQKESSSSVVHKSSTQPSLSKRKMTGMIIIHFLRNTTHSTQDRDFIKKKKRQQYYRMPPKAYKASFEVLTKPRFPYSKRLFPTRSCSVV